MTNFYSDDQTIRDLEKLIHLIQDGFNKAWDPDIIPQAKDEIKLMTSEAKNQIALVNTQIHEIENTLTIINSQKIELETAIGELKKAIGVSERLDRLVGELGGTEQLQKYLAKLEGFNFEELDQVFKKISEGQDLVVSLQQKSQELQKTTTSLIKKVENLGGEKLLIKKFDQVQEIAQRLDTVDSQIKSSIDNCLNQYLPDFKAGKVQIEQWRKETLLETQTTLNTINQKTQSIDTSIERLNQDLQSVRVLLNECERKELQLQSILDAITELTKSFGGDPLVSATIKKLTILDDFIAQEKSSLAYFKKELEESLDNEFEELIQRDEERITDKLADLDNFIISAKSKLNNIKKQIDEGLDQKSKKLVAQNLQELTKKQVQLEERLRNEFQSLLHDEIAKLETQYLQEIQRMRNRHFRLL